LRALGGEVLGTGRQPQVAQRSARLSILAVVEVLTRLVEVQASLEQHRVLERVGATLQQTHSTTTQSDSHREKARNAKYDSKHTGKCESRSSIAAGLEWWWGVLYDYGCGVSGKRATWCTSFRLQR
jgi:hypothetical protein